MQAIGDVRAELQTIAAEPLALAVDARSIAAPRPLWKRVLPVTVAALLASAATAAIFMSRPVAVPQVSRFSIALNDHSFTGLNRRLLDVSPDGSAIVYVANARFYLRPVNALDARPIPMSDIFGGPEAVVFSPDGQSIAFWARSDRTLKRMAIAGGAALTLTPPYATNPPWSLTWHGDHIYFGLGDEGIVRISENGGPSETIVKASENEALYAPRVLRGDRGIVFTSAPRDTTGRINNAAAKIEVYARETQQRTVIVPAGSDASVLPSGHLVYGNSGVIYAVPFDVDTLAVTGGPVPIVEGVQRTSGGAGLMSAAFSRDGLLAYVPGPAVAATSSAAWQLALFDKAGSARALKIPPANYGQPRVSPDGKLLAFVRVEDRTTSLWVHDLADTNAARRLTFDGIAQFPVWSPDNARIAFQWNADGSAPSIYLVRADGSGVPERVTQAEAGTSHVPYALSPDGQHLLFDLEKGDKKMLSIWSVRDRKAVLFGNVESPNFTDAQFSPDGRWVSYSERVPSASRATASVVFVQPFPPTGAKYQISPDSEDGHHAVWAPSGMELFYNPGPGVILHAVGITTKPSFRFTAASQLKRAFQGAAPALARPHDVMRGANGQPQFVGLLSPGAESGISSRIDVVLNWFEELKARAPLK